MESSVVSLTKERTISYPSHNSTWGHWSRVSQSWAQQYWQWSKRYGLPGRAIIIYRNLTHPRFSGLKERAIFFSISSQSPERGEINKADKQRSTLSPVIYVGNTIAPFPLQLPASREKPPSSRANIPYWPNRSRPDCFRQFGNEES